MLRPRPAWTDSGGTSPVGRGNWSDWDWQENEVHDIPPDKVLVVSLLRLRGLRSGIWVEHRWAYVFTVSNGRLLRQDGFDDKAQALDAVGLSE